MLIRRYTLTSIVVCFGWMLAAVTSRVISKRAAFYIANETMCIVDGEVFRNGDPVPTDDHCEKCTCRPPGFSCVLRDCEIKPGCKAVRRDGECCPEYVCGCVHSGKLYEDGELIRDIQNPCYTCRCHGSSISCVFADCLFRGDCAPEYVTGECCPRYDHCPPLSTSPPATIFTTTSTTTTDSGLIEAFYNFTTLHLEKFTEDSIHITIEDIQPTQTSFGTSSGGTHTPSYIEDGKVTVRFGLDDGSSSEDATEGGWSLSTVSEWLTSFIPQSTKSSFDELGTPSAFYTFSDTRTSTEPGTVWITDDYEAKTESETPIDTSSSEKTPDDTTTRVSSTPTKEEIHLSTLETKQEEPSSSTTAAGEPSSTVADDSHSSTLTDTDESLTTQDLSERKSFYSTEAEHGLSSTADKIQDDTSAKDDETSLPTKHFEEESVSEITVIEDQHPMVSTNSDDVVTVQFEETTKGELPGSTTTDSESVSYSTQTDEGQAISSTKDDHKLPEESANVEDELSHSTKEETGEVFDTTKAEAYSPSTAIEAEEKTSLKTTGSWYEATLSTKDTEPLSSTFDAEDHLSSSTHSAVDGPTFQTTKVGDESPSHSTHADNELAYQSTKFEDHLPATKVTHEVPSSTVFEEDMSPHTAYIEGELSSDSTDRIPFHSEKYGDDTRTFSTEEDLGTSFSTETYGVSTASTKSERPFDTTVPDELSASSIEKFDYTKLSVDHTKTEDDLEPHSAGTDDFATQRTTTVIELTSLSRRTGSDEPDESTGLGDRSSPSATEESLFAEETGQDQSSHHLLEGDDESLATVATKTGTQRTTITPDENTIYFLSTESDGRTTDKIPETEDKTTDNVPPEGYSETHVIFADDYDKEGESTEPASATTGDRRIAEEDIVEVTSTVDKEVKDELLTTEWVSKATDDTAPDTPEDVETVPVADTAESDENNIMLSDFAPQDESNKTVIETETFPSVQQDGSATAQNVENTDQEKATLIESSTISGADEHDGTSGDADRETNLPSSLTTIASVFEESAGTLVKLHEAAESSLPPTTQKAEIDLEESGLSTSYLHGTGSETSGVHLLESSSIFSHTSTAAPAEGTKPATAHLVTTAHQFAGETSPRDTGTSPVNTEYDSEHKHNVDLNTHATDLNIQTQPGLQTTDVAGQQQTSTEDERTITPVNFETSSIHAESSTTDKWPFSTGTEHQIVTERVHILSTEDVLTTKDKMASLPDDTLFSTEKTADDFTKSEDEETSTGIAYVTRHPSLNKQSLPFAASNRNEVEEHHAVPATDVLTGKEPRETSARSYETPSWATEQEAKTLTTSTYLSDPNFEVGGTVSTNRRAEGSTLPSTEGISTETGSRQSVSEEDISTGVFFANTGQPQIFPENKASVEIKATDTTESEQAATTDTSAPSEIFLTTSAIDHKGNEFSDPFSLKPESSNVSSSEDFQEFNLGDEPAHGEPHTDDGGAYLFKDSEFNDESNSRHATVTAGTDENALREESQTTSELSETKETTKPPAVTWETSARTSETETFDQGTQSSYERVYYETNPHHDIIPDLNSPEFDHNGPVITPTVEEESTTSKTTESSPTSVTDASAYHISTSGNLDSHQPLKSSKDEPDFVRLISPDISATEESEGRTKEPTTTEETSTKTSNIEASSTRAEPENSSDVRHSSNSYTESLSNQEAGIRASTTNEKEILSDVTANIDESAFNLDRQPLDSLDTDPVHEKKIRPHMPVFEITETGENGNRDEAVNFENFPRKDTGDDSHVSMEDEWNRTQYKTETPSTVDSASTWLEGLEAEEKNSNVMNAPPDSSDDISISSSDSDTETIATSVHQASFFISSAPERHGTISTEAEKDLPSNEEGLSPPASKLSDEENAFENVRPEEREENAATTETLSNASEQTTDSTVQEVAAVGLKGSVLHSLDETEKAFVLEHDKETIIISTSSLETPTTTEHQPAERVSSISTSPSEQDFPPSIIADHPESVSSEELDTETELASTQSPLSDGSRLSEGFKYQSFPEATTHSPQSVEASSQESVAQDHHTLPETTDGHTEKNEHLLLLNGNTETTPEPGEDHTKPQTISNEQITSSDKKKVLSSSYRDIAFFLGMEYEDYGAGFGHAEHYEPPGNIELSDNEVTAAHSTTDITPNDQSPSEYPAADATSYDSAVFRNEEHVSETNGEQVYTQVQPATDSDRPGTPPKHEVLAESGEQNTNNVLPALRVDTDKDEHTGSSVKPSEKQLGTTEETLSTGVSKSAVYSSSSTDSKEIEDGTLYVASQGLDTITKLTTETSQDEPSFAHESLHVDSKLEISGEVGYNPTKEILSSTSTHSGDGEQVQTLGTSATESETRQETTEDGHQQTSFLSDSAALNSSPHQEVFNTRHHESQENHPVTQGTETGEEDKETLADGYVTLRSTINDLRSESHEEAYSNESGENVGAKENGVTSTPTEEVTPEEKLDKSKEVAAVGEQSPPELLTSDTLKPVESIVTEGQGRDLASTQGVEPTTTSLWNVATVDNRNNFSDTVNSQDSETTSTDATEESGLTELDRSEVLDETTSRDTYPVKAFFDFGQGTIKQPQNEMGPFTINQIGEAFVKILLDASERYSNMSNTTFPETNGTDPDDKEIASTVSDPTSSQPQTEGPSEQIPVLYKTVVSDTTADENLSQATKTTGSESLTEMNDSHVRYDAAEILNDEPHTNTPINSGEQPVYHQNVQSTYSSLPEGVVTETHEKPQDGYGVEVAGNGSLGVSGEKDSIKYSGDIENSSPTKTSPDPVTTLVMSARTSGPVETRPTLEVTQPDSMSGSRENGFEYPQDTSMFSPHEARPRHEETGARVNEQFLHSLINNVDRTETTSGNQTESHVDSSASTDSTNPDTENSSHSGSISEEGIRLKAGGDDNSLLAEVGERSEGDARYATENETLAATIESTESYVRETLSSEHSTLETEPSRKNLTVQDASRQEQYVKEPSTLIKTNNGVESIPEEDSEVTGVSIDDITEKTTSGEESSTKLPSDQSGTLKDTITPHDDVGSAADVIKTVLFSGEFYVKVANASETSGPSTEGAIANWELRERNASNSQLPGAFHMPNEDLQLKRENADVTTESSLLTTIRSEENRYTASPTYATRGNQVIVVSSPVPSLEGTDLESMTSKASLPDVSTSVIYGIEHKAAESFVTYTENTSHQDPVSGIITTEPGDSGSLSPAAPTTLLKTGNENSKPQVGDQKRGTVDKNTEPLKSKAADLSEETTDAHTVTKKAFQETAQESNDDTLNSAAAEMSEASQGFDFTEKDKEVVSTTLTTIVPRQPYSTVPPLPILLMKEVILKTALNDSSSTGIEDESRKFDTPAQTSTVTAEYEILDTGRVGDSESEGISKPGRLPEESKNIFEKADEELVTSGNSQSPTVKASADDPTEPGPQGNKILLVAAHEPDSSEYFADKNIPVIEGYAVKSGDFYPITSSLILVENEDNKPNVSEITSSTQSSSNHTSSQVPYESTGKTGALDAAQSTVPETNESFQANEETTKDAGDEKTDDKLSNRTDDSDARR